MVGLVGATIDEIPVAVAVVAVVAVVVIAADEVAVVVDYIDGGIERRRKEEVPLLVWWAFLFEWASLCCQHWDQRVASMDACC